MMTQKPKERRCIAVKLLLEDDSYNEDEDVNLFGEVEETEDGNATLEDILTELRGLRQDISELKDILRGQNGQPNLDEGFAPSRPSQPRTPILPLGGMPMGGNDVMNEMFDGQRLGMMGEQTGTQMASGPMFSGIEMVDVNIPALNENI